MPNYRDDVWCKKNNINPKLYRAWAEMRQRCNNPTNKLYKYYGGRGILVCQRWDSFANFAADMGPHPENGLTLDRKNVNKNYSKQNCRWATRTTQSRNRRYNVLTEKLAAMIRAKPVFYGSRRTLARQLGISETMVGRVINGRAWAKESVR